MSNETSVKIPSSPVREGGEEDRRLSRQRSASFRGKRKMYLESYEFTVKEKASGSLFNVVIWKILACIVAPSVL